MIESGKLIKFDSLSGTNLEVEANIKTRTILEYSTLIFSSLVRLIKAHVPCDLARV